MAGLRLALGQARELQIDYLLPLYDGAQLPKHAIAAYAAHLAKLDDGLESLPLLYGDQAEDGDLGNPWLKPEWDPRQVLSQDYVSRACALPVVQTLRFLDTAEADRPETLYELILRLTQGSEPIAVRHVSRITATTPVGDWSSQGASRQAAVERVVTAAIDVASGPFGTVQVHWPLASPAPKVSLLIATRDKVDLLRTCLEGVLHRTDYPHIELIVADNDSKEPETLEYLDNLAADPRAKVVLWPHPFNYSAINNYAASFATGDYLCLLNNDIEVIHPEWLTELVREASRPGVGAVGARLLYPDRSIQHAGVAVGIGNAAGHAHRGLAEGEAGYFAQALVARGASAVTGACLLLAKQHFDAISGLDEKHFAIAYNDVDMCMKLRALGLTNIYTPAATLIHHESKSRGADFAPENLDRYLAELESLQERWDTKNFVDPWHHPHLDRSSETYRLHSGALVL